MSDYEGGGKGKTEREEGIDRIYEDEGGRCS